MLALLLVLAAAARGPDPAADPPRSLGGRRFLLTSRVPHPFPATVLTFRQGVAGVVLPDQPVLQGEGTEDHRMIAAVERLGLGVALGERVGLGGKVSGQVATGIDGPSAVSAGARAGMDWELGATVVAWSVERVQVSLNPGLYGSSGFDVVPATVVDAALAVEEADDVSVDGLTADLVQPTRTFGGGLGVAVATPLARRLGLVVGARARAGRAESGGAVGTPVSWSAGLALDARLSERHPLVLQVESRYRSLTDARLDSEATVDERVESRWFGGGGLFWRGRHEAELGLAGWTLLQLGGADERLVAGEAVLRVFL